MSFADEVTGHNRYSHYPFLSTMTLFETPFYRVKHTQLNRIIFSVRVLFSPLSRPNVLYFGLGKSVK